MVACVGRGAFAQAGGGAQVVVLPFVTTDDELVIYGKPVADAVARGLSKGGPPISVAREQGARADLAVELRASRQRRGKVRVEAVVRDAETGVTLSRVGGRSTSVGDLDVAAADLARKLRAPLVAAVDERGRRQARERAEVAAAPIDPEIGRPPSPGRVADIRPTVVVYQPEGLAAGGTLPVRSVATSALVGLLTQLGYRAIISSNLGVGPVDVAAGSARSAGARATLMLYVYSVDFGREGVLTARGSLRLMAVAPDRRVLVDRTLETGTVVGSRGDRHDALLRMVLAQAMEMSRKESRGHSGDGATRRRPRVAAASPPRRSPTTPRDSTAPRATSPAASTPPPSAPRARCCRTRRCSAPSAPRPTASTAWRCTSRSARRGRGLAAAVPHHGARRAPRPGAVPAGRGGVLRVGARAPPRRGDHRPPAGKAAPHRDAEPGAAPRAGAERPSRQGVDHRRRRARAARHQHRDLLDAGVVVQGQRSHLRPRPVERRAPCAP